MLVLHKMMMEPSNVTKKKGTTKCNKSIVKCDVETAERENEIIKCEKKKKEKKKGTTKCDKITVTYDLELHNVKMKSLNVRKNK